MSILTILVTKCGIFEHWVAMGRNTIFFAHTLDNFFCEAGVFYWKMWVRGYRIYSGEKRSGDGNARIERDVGRLD